LRELHVQKAKNRGSREHALIEKLQSKTDDLTATCGKLFDAVGAAQRRQLTRPAYRVTDNPPQIEAARWARPSKPRLPNERLRTLLANLRKEARRQERKPSTRLARAPEPSWSAVAPYRAVRPNASPHPEPGFRVITLVGAIGAVVPLIILSLEQDVIHPAGLDRLVGPLRVLIWPASVLTIGMQGPIFTLASLFAVLVNVATYLLVGSLVWLGLHPPRSITYLTVVGVMYLMLASIAALCELLLT
jgi:hypothetical protein